MSQRRKAPMAPGSGKPSIRGRMAGVTLIELLIVMVVVGVLAAIAIPSYRAHALRTHRVEAKSALLNLAAAQEKFYLQNNTYAGSDDLKTAPPDGLGLPSISEGGRYEIAIGSGDVSGFSATATAKGAQEKDAHCKEFSINEAGVKKATNDDCW